MSIDPTLKVVARLTDSSGNPLSGKTIYFYYSTDGSTWIFLTSSTTDSGGYVSTTYDATSKTWFKAEFRGDSQYDPASATAVWEPSGGQTTQPSECQPAIKTGISALDNVLFCVGNYGITLLVVIIAFFVLLLLLRR
ncbi:MAG: hypothetical protein QW680_11405 [Pyrobaculum sp.]